MMMKMTFDEMMKKRARLQRSRPLCGQREKETNKFRMNANIHRDRDEGKGIGIRDSDRG